MDTSISQTRVLGESMGLGMRQECRTKGALAEIRYCRKAAKSYRHPAQGRYASNKYKWQIPKTSIPSWKQSRRSQGKHMLKIYGAPHSRAFRVIWLANEIGIPYEHVPVTFSVPNAQCKEPWWPSKSK